MKWRGSKGFFLASGGSFNMRLWVEEETKHSISAFLHSNYLLNNLKKALKCRFYDENFFLNVHIQIYFDIFGGHKVKISGYTDNVAISK